MTRRRHHIPPQPKSWFCNLVNCFGDALQIRVAFKDKQPVASILTLQHKGTLVYKYGCSDLRFNNLGGTHLLFWRSIQAAKREGLSVFDLGRTDCDNDGLITFKDRWGAVRSALTYSRFTAAGDVKGTYKLAGSDWKLRVANGVMAHLPDRLLWAVGSLLYKHMG